MNPTTSPWIAHGEKHDVPLDRVLSRFGFFQAVFSCAEVFGSMGATRAMVVWKVDGKPLPEDRGPLRLVVVTDKEPSRHTAFDLAAAS
jgi:hypothetical protein